MQNQEIILEQLLKQLNRPLHFFLINALGEAPQLFSPSCRESIVQWLDACPLLKINKIPAIDERKDEEPYPLTSLILSRHVLTLFHFYQVTQPSYQPMVPKLSRWLLPESKEENALSDPIKLGHLSFEIANILFLLVQHGQFLLMMYNGYPFLQSILAKKVYIPMSISADRLNISSTMQTERNYMLLIADLLWYRSILWMLIYSIAFTYYIKILCAKNYSLRSLIKLVTVNQERKNFKNKIKSILLQQCADTTLKDAKDNYLFISYMLSFVSNKEPAKHRDWLSWFDDMSDFVLHNTKKNSPNSVDHLNRIYDVGNIVYSHLHFCTAHYLAQGIVKIGLVTLIMQTILTPESYFLDIARNAPSQQLSYGLLPWILTSSDSRYFSNICWITPFLYYMELQLWAWFLIPLVTGIIEMGVMRKMTDHYVHLNKENFRHYLTDIMEMMRNHYCLTFKAHEVDDFVNPAEKARKIHLIDNVMTLIHLHLQKPVLAGSGIGQRFFQVPNLLQNTLYQIACVIYKLLKLAYFISATITLFMMIFIIENFPKNHCRRMHNAASVRKKNQLESKISSAGASFFAPRQAKKDTKAFIFKPAFRYRAPTY